MSKRWSKTEIAHLKRHADSQTLEELAQRFHVETSEVRSKMEELGLAGAGGDSQDAVLEAFETALRLVHDGKWQKAAEAFEAVLADSDSHELSDRARQYLAICRHRLEGEQQIEDPYLAAVVCKNRGDVAGALKLLAKGRTAADDQRFAYLQASLHALAGDQEQAIAELGRAIRLDARNRVQAYHDPDFKTLRDNEEFRGLLEPAHA